MIRAAIALCLCLPLSAESPAPVYSFHFARIQYDNINPMYPLDRSKGWFTDYSDTDGCMDQMLTAALKRWTSLNVGPNVLVRLDSDELFAYPLIYIVEPEQLYLADADQVNLSEYLQRGGFVILDDFHGQAEYDRVLTSIVQPVLPDADIESLTPAHPLFRTFYDIHTIQQVPVAYVAYTCYQGLRDGILNDESECVTWETSEPADAEIHAVYCGERICMLLLWGSDTGDGLEHADQIGYPVFFTQYAYRLFTNIILYALTH